MIVVINGLWFWLVFWRAPGRTGSINLGKRVRKEKSGKGGKEEGVRSNRGKRKRKKEGGREVRSIGKEGKERGGRKEGGTEKKYD